METQAATAIDKTSAIALLRAFVAQRSGIDRRNYQTDWRDEEGRRAFNSDYRSILRDGRDARFLIGWAERIDSITGADIVRACRGRLEFYSGDDGRPRLSYTAGQYFAVEYRAAVCRAIASVIWEYLRGDGSVSRTADEIRAAARSLFGRGIASRYFA